MYIVHVFQDYHQIQSVCHFTSLAFVDKKRLFIIAIYHTSSKSSYLSILIALLCSPNSLYMYMYVSLRMNYFSVNACWHYYAQPIHCTCVTTLLRDDSMILLRKDGVSLDTTYCNRKFNVFLTIFKFADGMALCIPCDIRGAKNSPKTLFQIRPKRKKTNSS